LRRQSLSQARPDSFRDDRACRGSSGNSRRRHSDSYAGRAQGCRDQKVSCLGISLWGGPPGPRPTPRSARASGQFLLAILLTAGFAAAQTVQIRVLATTDLHGNIYPYDYYLAKPAARGLAKIATLIAQERSANPNTILLDCGDTIQGAPLET